MSAEGKQQADFDDSPEGWARLWAVEFAAAKTPIDKWHGVADKVVARFLDEREDGKSGETRINLFSSSVKTQAASLYGKPPKVSVGRRFADARDDVARVASEVMERTLNADMERKGDNFREALKLALSDRLLSGGAFLWLRYVGETEQVEGKEAMRSPDGRELAPAVPATERVKSEEVESEHVHRKDARWSPARTFAEVRWFAKRALMSREALVKRFGEKVGKLIPLNDGKAKGDGEEGVATPWGRAEVWEIWSKEHKRVFWYVEGYPRVLDNQPDPYDLAGFWPFPRPWFANLTTDKFLPRPDYVLSQDLHAELNSVSTRIDRLQRSLKAVGVYNATNKELARLLEEGLDNEMIAVENWAEFSEKAGLAGAFQMLPLAEIATTLLALRDYRREIIELLYQVEGQSDLQRGQQSENGTPGEAAVKARFGSVRLKALQDEFAQFATDAQEIRAELMAKKFQPETLLRRANVEHMGEDKAVVGQAVALLKDQFSSFRVEIKPESIAFSDFAEEKAERLEVLSAIGGYLQVIAPIAQQMPAALPFLLEMLQHSVAGLRGASGYEASLDRAIQSAQQQAQSPQAQAEDPKLATERMKQVTAQQKAQADVQKEVLKGQIASQGRAEDLQGDLMREQAQADQAIRQTATQKAIEAQYPTQTATRPPQ